MKDWLSAQTNAQPGRLALMADGQTWTYAELNTHVNRVATGLIEAGIRPGELVAALMPNHAEYLYLIHALARLGAVLMPLNTRLTASELRYPIDQTGCRWLIHAGTAGFLKHEGLTAISIDDIAATGEAALGEALPRPYGDRGISADRLQAVVFTSGTSGRPKGAMLTYGNQFYGAMASAYRIGTLPDDRWLCCLPLYHVGGLAIVLRCCLYGTTVVLQNGFDIDAVTRALYTQQITLISLVPTMLYRLLNEPEAVRGLQKARLVLLGGAAASAELLTRCVELGIRVAPTYGLTEACSQVATMLPDEATRKPGSVGKPLLFTSIRVVDEHGHRLPAGEYGEIVVSGPTVMQGYYNDPPATSNTLRNSTNNTRELYTGDIGYLDSDGDLWLVQRRSDLIVSGGENVYPAEVEQILLQHPAVAAVCVVGVNHPEWGQQVAAAIVLREGMSVNELDLIAFSRERLAGYKQPRMVRFVETLPQTASGKIQRSAVAEMITDTSA